MFRSTLLTGVVLAALSLGSAQAQDRPTLEIVSPKPGSVIELGNDPEKAIGAVVRSNFTLLPAGQCGHNHRCGHVHMKIDPAVIPAIFPESRTTV